MVRIFFGNFDKFAIFWKFTLICIFVAKSSHFPLTTRILQAIPCKMLFIGLNLEFLGAGFFDEERGSQTFQKHPYLVDPGHFFYKRCRAPQYLGGIPATPKVIFWRKRTFAFSCQVHNYINIFPDIIPVDCNSSSAKTPLFGGKEVGGTRNQDPQIDPFWPPYTDPTHMGCCLIGGGGVL